MAPDRSDAPKAERIDEVVRYTEERLSCKDTAAAEQFIRQYYARVPPQDVLDTPAFSFIGAD